MYQTRNKGDKIQLTKESTAEPANGFGPSLCLQTLPRLHCFNQIYSNVMQLNCQSARMPYHSIIIMGSKTLRFFVKDHRSAAICYTWTTGECSLCRAASMGKTLSSVAHSCSPFRWPKHLLPPRKISTNGHVWLLPDESWQRQNHAGCGLRSASLFYV